jgi:uncharacterized protein
MFSGWRGLGVFWLVVLLLMGSGATVLQVLGPPPVPHRAAAAPRAQVAAATPAPAPMPPPPPPLVTERTEAPAPDQPGRDTPGPVADPDPALLEPVADSPSEMLPRVAEDGRRPMQAYAAGFDRSSRRPRVGLLLAGIGLNEEDSNKAILDLPGGVTLAVSPYATKLPKLLSAARLSGHEYLLSIPMEPQSFPANDAGPRALMTNLSPAENLDRLRRVMAEVRGYVGITNALGAMRGERFAGLAEQMDVVLAETSRRGLLYIDARTPQAGGQAMEHYVWSRDIDLVVDEPVDDIDVKLAQLEQIAHDTGTALGLAGAPTPVTVQHIAAWAAGLLDRGLALAPVTALVRPPSDVSASAQ